MGIPSRTINASLFPKKDVTPRTSILEELPGVPDEFVATRYHSLVVERESLPACLAVTAQSEDGEIMGLRHRGLAVEGVQFHPEALLTEHGHRMLQNFLEGNTMGNAMGNAMGRGS